MEPETWPIWWADKLWSSAPPFDPRWPAFATGCAVFETVAVRAGVPWLWERHMARLERAAEALAPELRLFDRAAIEAGLARLIDPLGPLRLRSQGAQPGDSAAASALDFSLRITLGVGAGPLCFLTTRPAPQLPNAGALLWLAPELFAIACADPGAEFKHAGRFLKERAHREARAAGCFDALLPSTAGGFACASRGNLYAFSDGQWWTPPQSAGALPGVVRGLLLEHALVRERPLGRTALESAEELALSNALWLLWPVAGVRGLASGLPGADGPRWRELRLELERLARPRA